VAAAQTCQSLQSVADEVVCAVTPEPFIAVGAWYEHFGQTSDAEVHTLLEAAAQTGDRAA
jgi:putative phosphoribosyl transferase